MFYDLQVHGFYKEIVKSRAPKNKLTSKKIFFRHRLNDSHGFFFDFLEKSVKICLIRGFLKLILNRYSTKKVCKVKIL
jgi:hypothetical protein